MSGGCESHEAILRSLAEDFSRSEFDRLFEVGASLSLEEAVVLASAVHRDLVVACDGWHSLTQAERRVMALAAKGMTNREIAELLTVSPATVSTTATSQKSR